jgi:hypothetical protein
MNYELILSQSRQIAQGAIAMLTFLLIVGAMGGAIAYVAWNEKQMQEIESKE